jgi:hypothetical protein
MHFDFKILEEFSNGKELGQIQYVFNSIVSELTDYLKLQPLYKEIIIKLVDKNFISDKNASILDFGTKRIFQNKKLILKVNENCQKFLPFILLREAYYSFVPSEASEVVKIFINQIVENDFDKLSASWEWNKLLRDSLVNRDFIQSEFDKLKKFFKIDAKDPLESSVQFFFKEIREKALLSQDEEIEHFYDFIFEKYTYKTSKSLFNEEIVETLWILIYLFYENKLYLNLSDYQALFKQFKEKKKIKSSLSLRKFVENMQWINKCTSIAPSYDIFYDSIDHITLICIIKFNPLLEKSKIKNILEEWPFYHSLKSPTNSFETEVSLNFTVPNVYLNDLIKYFEILEGLGYIIKKELYKIFKKTSPINLNYFIEISNVNKIVDPNSIKYKKKYEIDYEIKYTHTSHPVNISLFDFIILERVRNFSVTGLTFDKRVETLNSIKEDIENELRKQSNFTDVFKRNFENIISSEIIKNEFLKIIEINMSRGFLNLYYQLNHVLNYLDLIINILNNNPIITNIFQLRKFFDTELIFLDIENQLLIKKKKIKEIIFRDFAPLYFQSRTLFKEKMEKIQIIYNALDSCYNIKILDLNKIKKVIKNPNLIEEIYQTRKKRYEQVFKPLSLYKITNNKIESTIEAFLKRIPPIIKPFLINTILTSIFAKYYPQLILKDTPEVYKALVKLKKYFPRMFIFNIKKIPSNKKLLCINTYFINIKEKALFLSTLYSTFKDSIITIKRYFWRGVKRQWKLEPKDFYDFKNNNFPYSEDLFKQLLVYSKQILGDKLDWPKYPLKNNIQHIFWSEKQNIESLKKAVKNRISRHEIFFDLKELNNLVLYRNSIEINLMDRAKFTDFKEKEFFKRYIKSIKFLPAFQKFGVSQYFMFFRPFFYSSPIFEIDLKLLFTNSFQKIKYPASIEPNPAIIGDFIFPLENPNKAYLNWLVKAKKNVSEYCFFYKKKFYDIIHFNRNLTKDGWNYSSIRFKSYMQEILFNPNYDPMISEIREFDINIISEFKIHKPDTQEFEALTQIYNIQSIDVKSYLATKKLKTVNYIKDLLKKGLIFPYLSLKNLDFEDKISIILPNLNTKFNEKLIKIFSFFNVCHIFEIEGEFFIYGFEDVKPFENGLLIEIWFPKCELDEFFEVFDLIFEYFKIKHYLILTDLVEGKHLLKSVYGDLKFLDEYNPLKNLIWNDKDKIWMNHKLFNEKFEPLYPDLLYGNKKEEI